MIDHAGASGGEEARRPTAKAGRKCAFPTCAHRWLAKVGAVRVCLVHMDDLQKTAQVDAWLRFDHYELPAGRPVFRFVRRRRGFEVWLYQGPSAANLLFARPSIPITKLAQAQANARRYAERHGFAYVDVDRVLSRETVKSLFRPEGP